MCRASCEFLEPRRLFSVQLVSDIFPGGTSSSPANLTNVNGGLFFTAEDDSHGVELWKSDGTAAGTVMVKDINPGVASSGPTSLTNVNGTLYFIANDGIESAVWKSDGTANGTVAVPDTSGVNSSLANDNGVLVFVHGVEQYGGIYNIWRSDGTSAGTYPVGQVGSVGNDGVPFDFTAFGNDLYFLADSMNGDEYTRPMALWSTDGNSLTDVYEDYSFNHLGTINGKLIFTNGFLNSSQLFESDGTIGSAIPIKSFGYTPPSGSAHPGPFTVAGTNAFFEADDGVDGRELWKTDGTAAGTQLVKDIVGGPDGSNPAELTNVNGELYFTFGNIYFDNTFSDLWKSDGTLVGTSEVHSFSSIGSLTSGGESLVFTANDPGNGDGLWTSDGTTYGTTLIGNDASSNQSNLTYVDRTLFFSADDGVHGTELWENADNGGGGDSSLFVDFDNLDGEPVAGATSVRFTMLLLSQAPLDNSSIGNSCVLVTGPNGFSQFATRVTSQLSNRIDFAITPPGGTLDAADNGQYTVIIEPNTIKNTAGVFAAAGAAGGFGIDLSAAIPPPAPAPVTGTVIAPLPANVTAGNKGNLKVRISNQSGANLSGPATVSLFLSADQTLDGSDAQLGPARKFSKLKSGQGTTLLFAFKYPVLPTGTYYVLTRVNSSKGESVVASSPFAITKPYVNDVIVAITPQTVVPNFGQPGSASVIVQNTGTALDTGATGIELFLSTDQTLDASDTIVATVPAKHLHLKPGAKKKLIVKLKYPNVSTARYFLVSSLSHSG